LVHVMELRVVFLIDECKVVLEWLEQNYWAIGVDGRVVRDYKG
jgi:hypothetical protein